MQRSLERLEEVINRVENGIKLLEKTQRDIASLQRRFESDSCDTDPADYKKKIKELRANEETYKGRLAEVKVSIGKYQAEI